GPQDPLEKLASRLEEEKNPCRQLPSLELSHNERTRLATDPLLSSGSRSTGASGRVRELNFLSPAELRYIAGQAPKPAAGGGPTGGGPGCSGERDFGDGDAVSDLTSGTYFPMMSDDEPPLLELGWPDSPARCGPSETQIYFQRDKSHNVKDIIRGLINRAKKVIALVMDVFTDVDLLCDLMEASNKRKVPVYILLDEKNLQHFTDMCSALDVRSAHMSNMKIRSTCGDTYCTKSGKKFTGQVLEKFMIIDCEEVMAGSYSFTWLSAQVHSNMVMHFSGRITDSFDREFRCLYADSQLIDCFYCPEDEGASYYQPYQAAMMSPGAAAGLDLLSDRYRAGGFDRVQRRETGAPLITPAAQSSSSVSSVKGCAPGTSSTVYKVTQGHDSKPPPSPQRRGSGQTPTPQSHVTPGPRGPANGGANHSAAMDRPPPPYGHPPGAMRPNAGAPSSKFQGLGWYDHMFTSSNPKAPPPPPAHDGRPPRRQRSPSNLFLNRLSDLFLPPSSKETFRRSPSPLGTPPWGGPDLSQPEPESQQSPPPPAGAALPDRADESRTQKRMTLGHSKLDLVNQYNQLKSRQVYSRFELKTSN
uniref:LOW QUALITY PROTEIN: protein FAM83C n=1 Tax=Gasterosteus aculeatus aculeatus TaxID=481459 RepID=UPI001A987038